MKYSWFMIRCYYISLFGQYTFDNLARCIYIFPSHSLTLFINHILITEITNAVAKLENTRDWNRHQVPHCK